jgi:hypothetical protein
MVSHGVFAQEELCSDGPNSFSILNGAKDFVFPADNSEMSADRHFWEGTPASG